MIIIAYKPGQLANRLFLFAKFLAYGYEHNQLIINPSFDDYARYFSMTKNQFIPASSGFKGYSSAKLIKFFFWTSFYFARILHRLSINMSFISVTYLDWSQHYDLDTDNRLKRKGIHFIQGWEFDATRLINSNRSKIIEFFQTGIPPVSPKETIEIYTFMEAASLSRQRNGAVVTLESLSKKL